MEIPIYYEELRKLIKLKKHIFLRTDLLNFFSDCINLLLLLTKRFEVIVVNFDSRDILITFNNKNNLKKIHLIYGMLEDSFQEIEFSIYRYLEELKGKEVILLFIYPKNFKNKTMDETVIFFSGFVKRISSRAIPLISVMHTSADVMLIETISSNAYKILPMRNEKYLINN